MAMLPARCTILSKSGNNRPSSDFLLSNSDWAQSISAFQVDLKEGRWDPQWIAEALEAHEENQSGQFDTFRDEEFEKNWPT
jgi:hypothetical protein